MDHPALVRVAHRVAHGAEELNPILQGEPAILREEMESGPADAFHGEVVPPLLGESRLVDDGDAGMLEPGEGPHLAPEHARQVVVMKGERSQDFQRDRSPRALLLRLEDDPHASTSQEPRDLEARYPGRVFQVVGRGSEDVEDIGGSRELEDARLIVFEGEQRFDLSAQRRVPPAEVIEGAGTVARRSSSHGGVDLLQTPPVQLTHRRDLRVRRG